MDFNNFQGAEFQTKTKNKTYYKYNEDSKNILLFWSCFGYWKKSNLTKEQINNLQKI
tara:strand:- start:457 stop:627 length:171 start_codon:yes stop_codon:yes gene_type:complete